MAHNPQAPQGPEGTPDPAGSTQMFRAFVDEDAPRGAAPQGSSSGGGSRPLMIVGVVVVVVIVAAVAWLALK